MCDSKELFSLVNAAIPQNLKNAFREKLPTREEFEHVCEILNYVVSITGSDYARQFTFYYKLLASLHPVSIQETLKYLDFLRELFDLTKLITKWSTKDVHLYELQRAEEKWNMLYPNEINLLRTSLQPRIPIALPHEIKGRRFLPKIRENLSFPHCCPLLITSRRVPKIPYLVNPIATPLQTFSLQPTVLKPTLQPHPFVNPPIYPKASTTFQTTLQTPQSIAQTHFKYPFQYSLQSQFQNPPLQFPLQAPISILCSKSSKLAPSNAPFACWENGWENGGFLYWYGDKFSPSIYVACAHQDCCYTANFTQGSNLDFQQKSELISTISPYTVQIVDKYRCNQLNTNVFIFERIDTTFNQLFLNYARNIQLEETQFNVIKELFKIFTMIEEMNQNGIFNRNITEHNLRYRVVTNGELEWKFTEPESFYNITYNIGMQSVWNRVFLFQITDRDVKTTDPYTFKSNLVDFATLTEILIQMFSGFVAFLPDFVVKKVQKIQDSHNLREVFSKEI